MQAASWLGLPLGAVLVGWTISSVVRTLIVPRGLPSATTRSLSRALTRGFVVLARRIRDLEGRDRLLAFQAPLWILVVLSAWVALLMAGFALMLWPFLDSFPQAMLEAGSSIFTLGFAATHDVVPSVLHFLAAGSGLIVIALQIGYLPTLYAAFNRRETSVTMLQGRAGAPPWGPELLYRYQSVGIFAALDDLYMEWERWAADVAESHTNYPVLIYLRSPHPLRSWVLGLLAVLDSAAMVLALCPERAPVQARLCLRMGFLCLRDIASLLQIPFDPDPLPTDPIELTYEEFVAGVERLYPAGFPVERGLDEAWAHFRGWRVNYESVAYALADVVLAPPGPWSGPRHRLPGMEIVPQRPADRAPGDEGLASRPKGTGMGH